MTHYGRVLAHLVPPRRKLSPEEIARVMAKADEISDAIERAHPTPIDAVEVAEGKKAVRSLLAPQGVGIGLAVVTWETHEEEEAAVLASDLLLRGADAHYVLAARLHSMPLVSWDDQQLARAGVLVPVGRPGEPLRWPAPSASRASTGALHSCCTRHFAPSGRAHSNTRAPGDGPFGARKTRNASKVF